MPDNAFSIDPDISRAWTLPSGVYAEPGAFARQREHVFARSWQLVGDEGLARVPGHVHPFTLLEGCLDEPLVLTRGMDDQVHCLSNVCTHRGNLVCEAPGNERHLRCRYHGRRFALDGAFQHMPEFAGVEGFPGPGDSLARMPLARWGSLLFVSLGQEVPFDEWMRPVSERVGWIPIERATFDPVRSRDYLVRANWALYCDNYLEGFHIPFVHASLNDALDYGAYRTELFARGSLQVGAAKGGEECFALPVDSPDRGQSIAAYYFWLFPNTMLNFYPWGLSINVVRPLGVDLTRVSFLSYVLDPSRLAAGAGAELDRVEREDEAIVESVQRGVRSRGYDRGRYSPAREQGVHHFHRLLGAAMGWRW